MDTVDVPDELRPMFAQAERVVAELFRDKREAPGEGTIEIAGERYLLVRAASLSVRFFELIREFYGGQRRSEADEFARGILFDLAHGIGKADAECYARRTGIRDPFELLAAGPVYFAHSGWARVRLDPSSVLRVDESFELVYEHPYSFEADSWLRAGASADFPVCIMNSGYSSGWCEAALSLPLVAAELRCRARGDAECQFVMAPPERIDALIDRLLAHERPCCRPTTVEVPDFMARKRMEEELLRRQAELERTAAELRRSERFLHDVVENMPLMVFVKEAASGRYVLFNRAAEELTGVSREQLLGKSDYDVFPKEQADFFRVKDTEALAGGTVVDVPEEPIDTVHGVRTLHTIKDPILDDEGRPAFLLGISEDITARKQQADALVATSEALRQAKDEAEQANRAKSQFLANMSHEIRTPMNGILGMTELLASMPLSGQQRDYVDTIRQSAETLLHLLNGILDLSKVEAGHLELEHVGFSLRAALGDALQTLGARASGKGLELIQRIPSEVPDGIVGDPIRLRQVILNLVDNAVKFTSTGEVVVGIELVERHDDRVRLRFEVTDTGPGIAVADRARVFKAFEQSNALRGVRGTGLGLAISSELVKMMGGELKLDSEVGRGSKFWFEAEFDIDESVAARGPLRGILRGLPVLVVDDNATNRRVVAELLASWRARPTTATSGPEALAHLRAAAERGQAFRVVLLDHRMPGMTGLEVARIIRADPMLRGTGLILLSSGGLGEEFVEARALGIGRFLIKPVKQSDLLNALERELGVADAVRGPARKSGIQPLRVLLAEDDPVNQKVAQSLLAQHGHEVTTVADGRAAVARVVEAGERFDVVLMDVRMPVLDGLEATRAIRRWERQTGGHVPIVAMTAQAMAGDRERCLAAGMDDYVAKPIRIAELVAVLARVVDTLSPARQVSSSPTPEPSAAALIDWERAVAQVGGSEETMREVVQVFLTQLPKLRAALGDAIAGNNPRALREVAHRLKGSAGALGAEPVAALARQLEQAGADGALERTTQDWSRLQELLSQLELELEARRGATETGPEPTSRE